MARVRSPNYPVVSLAAALERVRKIHAKEQHLAAPREVIAKHLGYGGMNGASAKVISAIGKYGLLEDAAGDKLRISQLAMSILFPRNPEEKSTAIRDAALQPSLFSELAAEYEGHRPSDENLRTYLIRRGFATDAIDRVIHSYRETMDLVAQEAAASESDFGSLDDPDHEDDEPASVIHQPSPPLRNSVPSNVSTPALGPDEPYRVSLTRGGIEGAFELKSADEVEELIRALEGLKLLFQPSDRFKRPGGGP